MLVTSCSSSNINSKILVEDNKTFTYKISVGGLTKGEISRNNLLAQKGIIAFINVPNKGCVNVPIVVKKISVLITESDTIKYKSNLNSMFFDELLINEFGKLKPGNSFLFYNIVCQIGSLPNEVMFEPLQLMIK
jgi:hypothetical protein